MADEDPTAATETPVAATATPVDDAAPQSAEDAVLAALGAKDDAEPQPEPEPEPEPADGPARDDAGRFKAKGNEPTQPDAAANKDASKPEVDASKPEPAKVDDPDTLPEGLSDKARERFQTLTAERNQWRERANQWQQTIASTGANPKQFGEMLEYERLVNSGQPADLRSALAMAKNAVRDIAMALGEDTQAVDVLEPFPDLARRVEEGELDRKTAMELVRARQQASAFEQQQQTAAKTQAEQAAVQAAQTQLDQLGQQLRARDPDFERKFEALKNVIPVIAESVAPAQWAQSFLRAYQGLNLPPAVLTPQRLPVSPQPLHGNRSGAVGLHAEPKNAEQAVLAALGL